MSRSLTEKKVLKKLGITDFRHITKDKVIEIATMLPQMDPEVAKKVLEQLPDYANNIKDIVTIFKDEIGNILASNDKSAENVYAAYMLILEKLSEELKQPELSFDEKDRINERLIQVSDKMREFDHDNKQFLLDMAGKIALGLATACVFLYGIFGNIQVNNQNYLDKNDDDDSNNHLLS